VAYVAWLKRTLEKVKLPHRSVALIHREAEGSLLAVPLLLALTALQQPGSNASPRQMLLQIRGTMTARIAGLGPRQVRWYVQALTEIHGEAPGRTSSKTRRPWPRPKKYKPPEPPNLRRLTNGSFSQPWVRSPAFRRFAAQNRLKAGLRTRIAQG
jgi:hypothetical protein